LLCGDLLWVTLLACAIATFFSEDDWYELAMLVWAAAVFVFQVLYMEPCIYNELKRIEYMFAITGKVFKHD